MAYSTAVNHEDHPNYRQSNRIHGCITRGEHHSVNADETYLYKKFHHIKRRFKRMQWQAEPANSSIRPFTKMQCTTSISQAATLFLRVLIFCMDFGTVRTENYNTGCSIHIVPQSKPSKDCWEAHSSPATYILCYSAANTTSSFIFILRKRHTTVLNWKNMLSINFIISIRAVHSWKIWPAEGFKKNLNIYSMLFSGTQYKLPSPSTEKAAY